MIDPASITLAVGVTNLVLRACGFIPIPRSVSEHLKKDDALIAEAYDLLDKHGAQMEDILLEACWDKLLLAEDARRGLEPQVSKFLKRWNPSNMIHAQKVSRLCKQARRECRNASNDTIRAKNYTERATRTARNALLAADIAGGSVSQAGRPVHDIILVNPDDSEGEGTATISSNVSNSDVSTMDGNSSIERPKSPSVLIHVRSRELDTTTGEGSLSLQHAANEIAGERADTSHDGSDAHRAGDTTQDVGELRARLHVVTTKLAQGAAEMTAALSALTEEMQDAASDMQTARAMLASLRLDSASVKSYEIHPDIVTELTGSDYFSGGQVSDLINTAASGIYGAQNISAQQATMMSIGSVTDVYNTNLA